MTHPTLIALTTTLLLATLASSTLSVYNLQALN